MPHAFKMNNSSFEILDITNWQKHLLLDHLNKPQAISFSATSALTITAVNLPILLVWYAGNRGRHTPSSAVVINLFVFDMAVALSLYLRVGVLLSETMATNPFACILHLSFIIYGVMGNQAALFLAVCDRYAAVIHPYSYERIVTYKVVNVCVVLMHLIYGIFSLSPLIPHWNNWDHQPECSYSIIMKTGYIHTVNGVAIFLMTANVTLYSRIHWVARKQSFKIRALRVSLSHLRGGVSDTGLQEPHENHLWKSRTPEYQTPEVHNVEKKSVQRKFCLYEKETVSSAKNSTSLVRLSEYTGRRLNITAVTHENIRFISGHKESSEIGIERSMSFQREVIENVNNIANPKQSAVEDEKSNSVALVKCRRRSSQSDSDATAVLAGDTRRKSLQFCPGNIFTLQSESPISQPASHIQTHGADNVYKSEVASGSKSDNNVETSMRDASSIGATRVYPAYNDQDEMPLSVSKLQRADVHKAKENVPKNEQWPPQKDRNSSGKQRRYYPKGKDTNRMCFRRNAVIE